MDKNYLNTRTLNSYIEENMTDVEIISLINNSLVEEFELESAAMVSEAEIFADLGLDSLDIVDMVVVLEGAFGVKIRDDESLREIRTLGDIHRFIIQKKCEKAAS